MRIKSRILYAAAASLGLFGVLSITVFSAGSHRGSVSPSEGMGASDSSFMEEYDGLVIDWDYRPPQPEVLPAQPDELLASELNASGAEWGIVVYDSYFDELVFAHNASTQFHTQSLVKILIAMSAVELGFSEAEVVDMLATSDDHTASLMWGTANGPKLVDEWSRHIGLEATERPADPNWWGNTYMNSFDLLALLVYLQEAAPEHHRDIIYEGMAETTLHGEDGYYQHFGIPDGMSQHEWVVKQGWACCPLGGPALNSVGYVNDRFIVVIQSRWDHWIPWADAKAEITEVAARIGEWLPPRH